MKRIFYTSLILIALCSVAHGQSDRQISAQNFVSVSNVISIPVSDTLVERAKKPDSNLKESGRKSTTPDADSSTGEVKNRYWLNAEYLLWRVKGSYLPPLAQRLEFTTPSSEILIGGREVNPGNSYGGRVTGGVWLNQERTVGLEASYFYLGPRSFNQSASGTNDPGNSFIIRPYNSAISTSPFFIIAYPLYARGTVAASLASHLQGGELNSVYDLGERVCCRLRLLGGFRFLDLKERLTIIDNHVYSNVAPLGSFSDHFYQVTDEFATRNRFYGGQSGIQTEFSRGRLRLEFAGKVALGGARQLVNINGSTFLQRSFNSERRVGGLLALDTNIGRYERTRFAVLPEGKASINFQLTDKLAVFAGYDFLYLNRVARPAEQIDLTINWLHVPFLLIEETPGERGGPVRPAFSFSDSPFWAQGLTLGLHMAF